MRLLSYDHAGSGPAAYASMYEAPSLTQTRTPKDPQNALKDAPSRRVYS